MSHQQSNSVIALVGRHSILFLINIYSLAPDNACTHFTFLLKDLGTKLTCIPLLNVRGCVPGPQTLPCTVRKVRGPHYVRVGGVIT